MTRHKILTAIALYLLGGQAGASPGFTPPVDVVQESAYILLAHESELELDNGQKWPVDRAMMVQFRQLENELKTFKDDGPESYQRLGKSLNKTVIKVVSGCTMEGQAHDELHKWLVPFMDDVDAFQEERDQGALKKRFLGLRSSFDVFNAHFR